MRRLHLSPRTQQRLRHGISLAFGAYLAGLAGWFALWHLARDDSPVLFLLNAFAVYLFVPLPVVLLAAVALRNRGLLAGVFAATAVFLLLWGGLFWPRGTPEAEGPVLRVITYNLLAPNPEPQGVIEALRASDADVIGLLELAPEVATAIDAELAAEYPYRILEPQQNTTGSGILSRLPFTDLGIALPDPAWIGDPRAVLVQFEGHAFVFVNAHSASRAGGVAARERQARLLSDFVDAQTLPVILTGDFNAQHLNRSHGILTEHLADTWLEAGSGFGNTFPGASTADSPASKRPALFGVDMPKWLVRIDYVFVSDDWQTIDARIGPWDGHSDHRPVIAEVALLP
jgi:vancomycin resistance protein VanJ